MRKSITRAAAAGSSMFDIQNGRQQLAQQFSAMDGWQRGTDPRFDEFVDKQRTRERYEAFDQRVERAYLTCTTLHKAEVTNGFKRHLTSTGTKFDASVLREMNQAIESRLEWLREVWAQIDADYRSTDTARQEAASQEISRALRGEPSDYMAWAYERKQDARRKGPKGKVALESEFEDTNLPTVSDDEANRYLNLRINMLEIERRVKEKFGIAGQQHWGELQAQKDRDYEDKLDQSVEKYKELLDQQSRYDESKRHTPLRQVLERTHEANVRYRAAMEMEQERERLLEAHKEMTEERQKAASERRKLQLRDAAELRAAGKTSEEVVQMMKLKAYDEQVQQQDSYRRQEKREIQKKKDTFLTMIEKLRRSSEEREGRDLMQPQLQRSTTPSEQRPVSAFGFADDDVYDAHTLTRANEAGATAVVDGSSSNDPFRLTAEEQTLISKSTSTRSDGRQQELSSTTNNNVNKRQLWNSINADRYEDPFTTVHQARMDADKNYDQMYAKMLPTQLIPGSGRMSRQGMGDMAAGNEQDRQILQGGQMYQSALQWDNPHGIVHNLDGDGEKEYFLSDVFHIRDKKTGDIDWRFERRSGGVTMRGPKFYKPGERRAAADPGSKTVEPIPASAKLGANGKKIRRRSTPIRSE